MPIPSIRASVAARITSSAEREAELAREIRAAQQEPNRFIRALRHGADTAARKTRRKIGIR